MGFLQGSGVLKCVFPVVCLGSCVGYERGKEKLVARQVREATRGLRGELAEGAEGFKWASRRGKAVFEGQGRSASLSSEVVSLSGFECNIYEALGDVVRNGGLRIRFEFSLTPKERRA